MRRLRQTKQIRNLVSETDLLPDRLIYPLFVTHGKDVCAQVESMPGCFQMSINNLVEEAKKVHDLGIPGILLFGIPAEKDEAGSGAYDDEGIIQMAVAALKEEVPELILITDVCLCEYTSHGHCGIIKDGEVNNDLTLEMLAKMAVSHAEAGADIVAPSDMMDGRVAAIRSALDNEGFSNTPIMSYAAKYASSFYGPFREAAQSAPEFGDRCSYQMDPRNSDEAVRECLLDIEEGADIIMVKPALPYLDIIYRVKQETKFPRAAYNVSGEYSMIKAAAAKGWLDEKSAVLEALTSIRRAGADIIITYFAKDVAAWLKP
jgi:porphobilinogen synthase